MTQHASLQSVDGPPRSRLSITSSLGYENGTKGPAPAVLDASAVCDLQVMVKAQTTQGQAYRGLGTNQFEQKNLSTVFLSFIVVWPAHCPSDEQSTLSMAPAQHAACVIMDRTVETVLGS